jgi:dTDP-4-dehydrorhamnose 3,5-epimerase
MQIKQTKIKDCYEIFTSKFGDQRGYFSRLYCKNILKKFKLRSIAQINTSFSSEKGTLRGMHYQKSPFQEDKIVYCTSGEIYDVVLDIRKKSKTCGMWVSRKLSPKKGNALIVPRGCAHGFLTLKKNTQIVYFVTNFYNSSKEGIIKYNDKKYNIKWPISIKVISKKDNL